MVVSSGGNPRHLLPVCPLHSPCTAIQAKCSISERLSDYRIEASMLAP